MKLAKVRTCHKKLNHTSPLIPAVYQKFMDSVIGVAIMATGLPIYFIFVKNSYPSLRRKTEKFTIMLQKLLLIVEQDAEIKDE